MSIRILIVDDSAFMRSMLKNIFLQRGYKVVGEAENARQAVEMYVDILPDVVTMDITMPEMNGIDGTRAIRSTDPGANIIMCTAMGQQHLVMNAIQAGAKDFIIKPYDRKKLLQAVEKVLTRPGVF